MLSFVNDYSEGAHPKILERLNETNFEQLAGYGSDRYCEQAKEKICASAALRRRSSSSSAARRPTRSCSIRCCAPTTV